MVTPEERYFEDYQVGMVDEFGEVLVTAEEIVEFARRYDPQTMHVDAVAAASGRFGGLIASGWHTGSLTMRMFVEHYLSKVATLPSPGIDELRRSKSKPDRGIVRSLVEVLNQNGEVVMSQRPMNLMLCRDAG
jgi:acyl dehydratase